MDYIESIKFITSKDNFYIDLGLQRILSVLEKFGNPQEKLKCIHVAGTNGKGSVCAIIDSILREAGYKTGLFTSPHIWEYTERIKINGQEIPKERFAYYVEKIKKINIHLTEFEILTTIMFLYFKDENIDVAIIETGLGGRLDATNVITKNLCAIITHIDLDHTERLGNTKEQIAKEKAGIIKKNCPVITSMGYEVIRDKAELEGSMFILLSPYINEKYINSLALKGEHQIENLALALEAINYLFKNISQNIILEGLKKVQHPCRFQYIKSKNLIIDASHNPNGIEALRNNLDLYYPDQKRRIVFGCLKTKDYEKMMNILFRENDELLIKEFSYPNSCSYEELSKKSPFPLERYKNITQLTLDKLNIICGSFYMISEIIKRP